MWKCFFFPGIDNYTNGYTWFLIGVIRPCLVWMRIYRADRYGRVWDSVTPNTSTLVHVPTCTIVSLCTRGICYCFPSVDERTATKKNRNNRSKQIKIWTLNSLRGLGCENQCQHLGRFRPVPLGCWITRHYHTIATEVVCFNRNFSVMCLKIFSIESWLLTHTGMKWKSNQFWMADLRIWINEALSAEWMRAAQRHDSRRKIKTCRMR